MEDIENILDTLIFDGKVEKTTKGDNAKFYRAIGKSKISHCSTEYCQSNFINVSIANWALLGAGLYKKKEFFRTRRLKNHFN